MIVSHHQRRLLPISLLPLVSLGPFTYTLRSLVYSKLLRAPQSIYIALWGKHLSHPLQLEFG